MNDPPSQKLPPAAPPAMPAGDTEPPAVAGSPQSAPAPPPAPLAPLAPPAPPASPAIRARTQAANTPPRERRDFFGEAVREILLPFSGLIERKIHPLLAALESIPDHAERLANSNFGLLDQPQPARRPLPQLAPPPEPKRVLRPPGAASPGTSAPLATFESVCSRCGKCVEACPVDAIKLDPHGLVAEGLPYIVAERQPCVVCAELACMKSCPTGALKVVDRLAISMGKARVDHLQCLRNHGENCTLCVDVCPIDGKTAGGIAALFISPDSGRIRVRKNICVGCGLCESRCPTEPRAITVTPHIDTIDPIIA